MTIFFKRCENCGGMRFKWTVKSPEIYVAQLKGSVRRRWEICGGCRKKVESALKKINV